MIGYCSNVHAGESWESTVSNLSEYPAKVRSYLQDPQELQLGIWISAKAAEVANQNDDFKNFRKLLKENEFKIQSLNAFPFGHFHEEIVKKNVYQPTWQHEERLSYLKNLLRILKKSEACAQEVSISTLPLGFQSELNDPSFINDCILMLSKAVETLVEFEKETGIKVHLSIEPEPHCVLEKSSDVVQFYKSLFLNSKVSESILLDKLRICYDTCHAAIQFEEPNTILKNYQDLGIQVGKVQISSALVIDFSKHEKIDLLNSIKAFLKDQKYLHQVVGYEKSERITFEDLPQAYTYWSETNPQGEYRIHFHVPVDLNEYEFMTTTQNHILDLFQENKKNKVTDIWEVETYTWDVLPKNLRTQPLHKLIAHELNWSQKHKGIKI